MDSDACKLLEKMKINAVSQDLDEFIDSCIAIKAYFEAQASSEPDLETLRGLEEQEDCPQIVVLADGTVLTVAPSEQSSAWEEEDMINYYEIPDLTPGTAGSSDDSDCSTESVWGAIGGLQEESVVVQDEMLQDVHQGQFVYEVDLTGCMIMDKVMGGTGVNMYDDDDSECSTSMDEGNVGGVEGRNLVVGNTGISVSSGPPPTWNRRCW